MKTQKTTGRQAVLSLAFAAALLAGATRQVLGDCGPFTDITFFCSPILELYYLGISAGTSPTTYSPNQTTTRGEIAAFIARSFNQSVKRSSRRAALGQWWTPRNAQTFGLTELPPEDDVPSLCATDGADIWVPHGDSVSRVRASDGRLLETWSGATNASGVLSAMGRIFVTAVTQPGKLLMIDPSQPAGAATTVASNLGDLADVPIAIAFDGSRIWSTNGASVSSIVPGTSLPWSVTTVRTGFSGTVGILYDGTNIWVTDYVAGTLLKLDSNGAILQTVQVGQGPEHPVFDGTNIWVPNANSDSVSVVRASNGGVMTTLTGNGLNFPVAAAFDGERVLVTNARDFTSVSLWRAADLTPLGSTLTGAVQPWGACSDGLNFWIVFRGIPAQLARF